MIIQGVFVAILKLEELQNNMTTSKTLMNYKAMFQKALHFSIRFKKVKMLNNQFNDVKNNPFLIA